MAEVVRHFCNFGFRVAAGRGVAAGKGGGDAQVVEPAEDAFFRDAQYAREDGEVERGIRFQCRGIETAKEADGFVVIAVRPCTLERRVVFVDEQDGFLFVVSFEKLAQEEKTVFHRFKCCLAGRDAFKCSPHVIVHFILRKIFEGTVQSGKLPCDVFLHAFPGIPLDVFHRQKDDGPLPLLGHGFLILSDGQSLEEFAVFFSVFEVEKALHHRQQERLAEAPRARQERHGRMVSEEFLDEGRLVYEIIAVFAKLVKEFHSDRNFPLHQGHVLSYASSLSVYHEFMPFGEDFMAPLS